MFEKRLTEVTPAEDHWNVPSDDIWKAAKPHFPKEKKKRRPFFFILFGLGILVAGLGLTFGIIRTSEQPRSDHQLEASSESMAANVAGIKTKTNTPTPAEKLSESSTAKTNHTSAEEVTSDNTQTLPPKAPAIKASNAVKKDQNVFQLDKINEVKPTEGTIETSIEAIALPSNTLYEKPVRNTLTLDQLPLRSSELTIENKQLAVTLQPTLPIIKPLRNLRRWEIGLSYSPFIINLRKAFNEDNEVEGNGTIDANFKYRNLNLPISRRFNRKWSMTSGLSAASIDLDLAFETEDVYETVPDDATFRKILEDKSPGGSISVNDAEGELQITFTNDANLQNGDTLLIQGELPIQLRVVQFPVLLNYHFGKGRFEGLVHTGFALDYYQTKLKSIEFDVYKNNNLISEEIDFEEINEGNFGYSLYFGAGVKYHINDRFNIGISSKLDLTELLLSRHEIGVYYGF